MANRTFKFIGLGFGSEPATVVAKINSTVVYSGAVPTVDQVPNRAIPVPQEDQVELFSIADSAVLGTDFAGSLPMTVEVTGGLAVNFGLIDSNYYQGNIAVDPNVGTATGFLQNYTGIPANSDNSEDPRSSVAIDGTPQNPARPPNGCYNWLVQNGSTLAYNFNISLGQVGNVVGNVANYSGPYTTTA